MELPLQRFSIYDFCVKAQELSKPQDEADHTDFIKFVLCGIHEGEQAVVDPYLNAIREQELHPLEVTRDFDSFLGFDKDIIVETDMTVSPVSRHADALTKSIHLTLEIANPEDPQKPYHVPFHKIPNLEIGKWEGRNSVRAFFPSLWSPGCDSPILEQEKHAQFYDCGLRPAVDHLDRDIGLSSEWPPTYTDEMFRARTTQGHLAFQTKVLRRSSVRSLGRTLRRSLEAHRVTWAKGMLFMHQVQGVKAATMHVPLWQNTGTELLGFLERNHISPGRMQADQWFVDVALQVKSQTGQSLQWRADSHGRLVAEALRISEEQANQITSLRSSKYSKDTVAHLVALAGCRVEPGVRTEGPFEAKYVSIYSTDKAHTYAKEAGRSAKFMTCEKTLKLKEGEPSQFCYDLHNLFVHASQGHHPSNARLEVRVPLGFAEQVLENFDEDILRRSLLSFSNVEWSLRAYRARAICLLLKAQTESISASRAVYGSLILTAGCVWLANSLHCRPDDKNASRNLMRCIFPHTPRAGADPSSLAYLRGSLAEGEAPDAQEPTLPYHPYGMFFFTDFLTNRRHSPRFSMGGRERLTDGSFEYFFIKPFDEISTYYFRTGVLGRQGVHPSRVMNKAVITPRFYHDEPETLPDLFNTAALGTIGDPIVIDDGSDLEEGDIAEPEGTLDNTLSKIWRQFIVDLLSKSPNQKGAGSPSYLKIALKDRLISTDEVLKSKDLAKYWTDCAWKVAGAKEWEVAFRHLWPPKAHILVGAVQNYGNCSYYLKWKDLLSRMTDADAEEVRKQIRARMDRLMWWPNAQQDRIWCTRVQRHFTLASSGQPQKGPAPQLLVRFRPRWTPAEDE
ncbi:hypothetical protein BD779DRAFT_1682604 [Infundibulicybe gibba]|nr:hypothetical protein BD779DRAFT_1682604 [Infundibulicybe gibba]